MMIRFYDRIKILSEEMEESPLFSKVGASGDY